MKQNIFRGLVPMMAAFMLLTICPINVDAKKIKYSEQIVYNGKVDANGQPNGEGTLTTTYGEYKNILEGFFNNGVVSNATLRLRVYDKKYEYFHYNGDVEFAVIDNKSVSYKIKGGTAKCDIDDISKQKLYYVTSHQLRIDSDKTFQILTTPDANSCHVQSDSIFEWFNHRIRGDIGRYYSGSGVEYTSTEKWFKGSLAYKYAEAFCLGWIAEVKTRPSLRFNDKFKLVASDNPLISVKGDNGEILQVFGDTILLSYPNGDYCKCYVKDKKNNSSITNIIIGTIIAIKKTLKNGVLGCKEPGVVTFTDNKTNKTGTVALKSGYTLNGTLKYERIHPLNIFDKSHHYYIFDLDNDNFKNVDVFYGKAGEAISKVIDEDPKGYLDFGAALIDEGNVEEAEYWINKAVKEGLPEAKKYVAEQEAKEEEETRRILERYHAHQDGSGVFYVNNMIATESGAKGFNLIKVGLCYQYGYGIDKDKSKAFTYYKDAIESSDEEARACAHLLLGMCYWKGEGTVKTPSQAFKEFSSYSEFSKNHWSGFEDIIPKWVPTALNNIIKPKEMLAYKHYYHAQCYEQGIGTQKFLEEAIGFYAAAIQYADIADAYYKLGYYAEKGKFAVLAYGIPNRSMARDCYRKAAQLGDNRAKQALNRM